MKLEIFAQLDLEKDVIELDDDLTEEEIEEEIEEAVYDYVSEFFDWGYKRVEDQWI